MKIKISILNDQNKEVDFITRDIDRHLTLSGVLNDLYLLIRRQMNGLYEWERNLRSMYQHLSGVKDE